MPRSQGPQRRRKGPPVPRRVGALALLIAALRFPHPRRRCLSNLVASCGGACTFSLGEFFCTRGRDLGTLAMQNKYCGRRQHGKQEPTTLKFLLFFS